MTNKSHREKLDKKIEMVGMARKNITPDDVETLLIKDGLIKLSSSLKNNYESDLYYEGSNGLTYEEW